MEYCVYGCGKEAIFQLRNKNWICSKHSAQCPVNKKKNSNGLKKAHVEGRVPGWNDLAKNCGLNRRWSKGLTKETDERIKKQSETYRKNFNDGKIKPSFLNKTHSVKTRDVISKKRIEFLENTNKHCNWYTVDGIKVQGTLEKKFAEFLVSNDIRFERKRLKYQKCRRYTPDFYIQKFDIYVEVKGFLFEKDKAKLKSVLLEHDIDLRLIMKDQIESLKHINDIMELPKVHDFILEIDYSKFEDHWGR
jgi:hypothetical protein